MKRHWVFALAALVLVPGLASAQDATLFGPRLRITPYVGVSPSFSQKGTAVVVSATDATTNLYEVDYTSSLPVGLNAEYRFWNRFGAMVGAAWSHRGNGTLIDFANTDQAFITSGSDLWLVKADLAVHLYELNSDMQLHRISASVFAGPVYVKDRVRQSTFTPAEATNTVDFWGLNLGAEAEVPTANPRLALVLGAENSLLFWNNTKYGRRVEGYLSSSYPNSNILIQSKKSNLGMVRVGLSFRF